MTINLLAQRLRYRGIRVLGLQIEVRVVEAIQL